MAVKIGSARSDENGRLTGGKAGDQTGKEVSTQNWYKHSKGWVVIRAKDATAREKIAKSMEMICANNHIGYDQSQRNTLFNLAKPLGFDSSRVTKDCECDCSAAVRVCVHYAGITCADFNTSSQKSVLQKTGKFDIITESKYTDSSDYLLRGDILVTKTKGHTVVVLSNGAKAVAASTTSKTTVPTLAMYTVKSGTKGTNALNLQKDLNYLGYRDDSNTKLAEDGSFGPKSVQALKKFQKAVGITVDGAYGKNSYAKMQACLK